MNYNANIAALFAQAFGTASPIYLPWLNTSSDFKASDYSGVSAEEIEDAGVYSMFGTPVLNTIRFEGGTYQRYNSKGMIENVTMQEYILPYATIVDFSRQKTLSSTNVLGGGSVTEIYSGGEFDISMRGIIFADESRANQKTLSEQQDALWEWDALADAINVSSSIFVGKDISAITIKSLAIRPVQGNSSVLSFEISAKSETPVELLL